MKVTYKDMNLENLFQLIALTNIVPSVKNISIFFILKYILWICPLRKKKEKGSLFSCNYLL